MNTEHAQEFITDLDSCTFHYGVHMCDLTIKPPVGQKIGLNIGAKIALAFISHADLVAALEGMLPTNTGYCNSMDWQRYDTAVHFAKIALSKAKGE